jgi:hypothetical protein
MSVLSFDPWEALKRNGDSGVPAKAANPANLSAPDIGGLAELAGFAGAPLPQREMRAACETRAAALAGAFDAPDVVADRAAIIADVATEAALWSTVDDNPLEQTADDPVVRGLLLGWERHRPAPGSKRTGGRHRAAPLAVL